MPDNAKAYEDACRAVDAIFASATRAHMKVEIARDKIIYHYTSIEAIQSIFSRKELWASDVRFLNDARELMYGYNLFREIATILSEEIDDDDARDLVEGIITSVNLEFQTAFAGCLCKNPDLLSQWRGYGRSGVGFNLGFSTQYLLDLPIIKLRRVLYDKNAQTKVIQEILGEIFRHARLYAASLNDAEKSAWQKHVARHVEALVVVFKHEAFAEEREFRIYVASNDVPESWVVQHRPFRDLILPYLCINLTPVWPRVIAEIWVGPNNIMELRKTNMIDYLSRIQMEHVHVRTSEVPYRL
jgi:hypothetical protein